MPRLSKWPGIKLSPKCQGCVNKTEYAGAHLDECTRSGFLAGDPLRIIPAAEPEEAEETTDQEESEPKEKVRAPAPERGRVLVFKVIFNKPDAPDFNTLTSPALFEDISKTIRQRYFFFEEHEIDVIWCSDDWNP